MHIFSAKHKSKDAKLKIIIEAGDDEKTFNENSWSIKALPANPTLKSVKIQPQNDSYQLEQKDKKFIDLFVQYLRSKESVNCLEFSQIEVMKGDMFAVSTALQGNLIPVSKLGLKNVGEEATVSLLNALKMNTTVSELDISFSADSTYPLIAMILKETRLITTLRIQWRGRLTNSSYDWVDDMLTALGKNSSLTALTLEHSFGDSLEEPFTQSLSTMASLEKLTIRSDRISLRGLHVLASSNSLTNLDMSHNRMARSDYDFPLSFGHLITLKLCECELGEDDFRVIATALKNNTTLTHLDLSDNKGAQRGFGYIAAALKVNSTLEALTVAGSVDPNPALYDVFRETLKHNYSLKELHLENKPYQNDAYEEVIQFLIEINKEAPVRALIHKEQIPEEMIESKSLRPAVKFLVNIAQESVLWKRVKIMILGHGRIGKTTLLHYLKYAEAPDDMISSEGIDVDACSLEIPDVETTTWDFGGQMEYHVTHQHFLSSKNAIYMLCFSLEDFHADKVEYWLKWMCTHLGTPTGPSPKSQYSIILIGLKKELLKPPLTLAAVLSDLNKLRINFHALPILEQPLLISSFQKIGRDELLTTLSKLCAQLLDDSTKASKVPRVYRYVFDKLQPLQTLDDKTVGLQSIMEVHKQLNDPTLEAETFGDAIDYLHHVGIVVKTGDFVCLKPKWVTKVLALFIAPEEVRLKLLSHEKIEHGVLTAEQIDPVLRHKDIKDPGPVVTMMENLEICFRFGDAYMFPSLLPLGNQCLTDTYSQVLGVRYRAPSRLTVIPPGMFCALQINVLRKWAPSEQRPEATNNYLCVRNADSCEIVLYKHNLFIDIVVAGNSPAMLVGVMLEVQRIINNSVGLKYKGLLVARKTGDDSNENRPKDEDNERMCLCPHCTKDYYSRPITKEEPPCELTEQALRSETIICKSHHQTSPGEVIIAQRKQMAVFSPIPAPQQHKDIRILCIGNGEAEALRVLNRIEHRAGAPIYELFDLICGSSLAAVVAVGLGRFFMKAPDCGKVLEDVASKASVLRTKYDQLVLEATLQHFFPSKVAMLAVDHCPKVFVAAVAGSNNSTTQVLFRSYDSASSPQGITALQKREIKCWEAVCASLAKKSIFGQVFEKGTMSLNALTSAAILEAQQIWPDTKFACVVSVGEENAAVSPRTPRAHDVSESILKPKNHFLIDATAEQSTAFLNKQAKQLKEIVRILTGKTPFWKGDKNKKVPIPVMPPMLLAQQSQMLPLQAEGYNRETEQSGSRREHKKHCLGKFPGVIRVLFVESNPPGTQNALGGLAFRQIDEVFQRRDSSTGSIQFLPAATWPNLQRALQEYKPTVLHIWAHGERDGEQFGIIFSDNDQLPLETQKTKDNYQFRPDQLAALVERHKTIGCVVLSVCLSAKFVEEVHTTNKKCSCVGFTNKVNAHYMVRWCAGFYQDLLQNKTFEESVTGGFSHLKINPPHDSDADRKKYFEAFESATLVKSPSYCFH